MKRVLSSLSIFAVLLGLGACHKSSSDKSNIGFDTPVGVFKASNPVAPGDTSRYTAGCRTPGQDVALPQVDSRLRPGMVFDVSLQMQKSGGFMMSATVETTIKSTSSTVLVEEDKLLSISGVPNAPAAGFSAVETSTQQADGTFSETSVPTVNFTLPSSSCGEINNVTSQSSSTYDGQFTTANGKTFNAVQNHSTLVADVTCDGVAYTGASQTFTLVSSNDMPSPQTEFCGGMYLYISEVTAKADGTIISQVKSEITSVR